MAEITTTERLPFPLAKPNPDTYVTKASEIGYGDGSVEDALNKADSKITPLQFGAVGDGVTDDKPAFIAAINALAEGGTLYIPNGVYLCVDLDITKSIKIVGESREKTIIYNNTSGKPCFKSSINYLEISNLQFKAIPFNTPGIDRTTNLYEENNGRSGLLYKGEYGTFHDIIGDDVRTIIWLGGDFLPLGMTKKGNTVYNITARRTCQCVLGCQQENCTIRNISGSFYNFRDWNSQLPDGGLAYDDTDFVTGNNPAHIVYITVRPVRKGGIWEGNIYEDVDADEIPHSEIYDGNYSWSKNINIHNVHSVSGVEAQDHASSAVSIKGIIGGELTNVTAINASSVWMYSLKNYSVHNIVCLNNTSYRFAIHCQDDFYIIPLSERTGDRPICYNNIIDTVICSGGYASFRAAGDAICKIRNVVLDTNVAIPGVSYLFGLYGAYWAEIDGLRVTNPNAELPSTGDIVSGGVALGTSLGYLRDGILNIANGLPYIGGLNSDFEISNCTPTHPSSVPMPTSNKMYELTPVVESDRNILRENDVNAGETFLTATIDNDKQVMITPLLLYGLKEQHFKVLITNKGTQAIPVRCVTSDLSPVSNPNFDYVRTNVPIDRRVLEPNNAFLYEVWRKDRGITVIFNGDGFGSYNDLTDKPIIKTADGGFCIVAHDDNMANNATAQDAFAEGEGTEAAGLASHAEGFSTTASEDYSHAEGQETTASGIAAHAEGCNTTASDDGAHAEGDRTTASGLNSHAEGTRTTASGTDSHAEGLRSTASGYESHAEGLSTTASGNHSHAEGKATYAAGMASHAEGSDTYAASTNAHVEGNGKLSIFLKQAYTQGDLTIVTDVPYPADTELESPRTQERVTIGSVQESQGVYICTLFQAFSEDIATNQPLYVYGGAIGENSHAEGCGTAAANDATHAEGYGTIANGLYSKASGEKSYALGRASEATCKGTQVLNEAEFATGAYNKSTSGSTRFSVGIGSDAQHRKNAYEVTTDGSVYIKGIGGYDGTNIGASGVKSVQQVIQDLINA